MVANQLQKNIHGRNREEKLIEINREEKAVKEWQRPSLFYCKKCSLLWEVQVQIGIQKKEKGQNTSSLSYCKRYCG